MSKGPMVRNAANEDQVKAANAKARNREEQARDDLRALLALPAGRRFIWRLLEHCKVFESIWDPSSRIHHNSGKQDVGHFVMAQVVAAEEMALIQMMKEAKGDLADE